MSHRHRAKITTTSPFQGPVTLGPQNRAAHGGVRERSVCACGAVRVRNLNGRHVESGGWVEPARPAPEPYSS